MTPEQLLLTKIVTLSVTPHDFITICNGDYRHLRELCTSDYFVQVLDSFGWVIATDDVRITILRSASKETYKITSKIDGAGIQSITKD